MVALVVGGHAHEVHAYTTTFLSRQLPVLAGQVGRRPFPVGISAISGLCLIIFGGRLRPLPDRCFDSTE